MEWIEFAIVLVHYEPLRSGQPPNLLKRMVCSDPIELLSTILFPNNGQNESHTPFMVTLHVVGGVWGRLILCIACISPVQMLTVAIIMMCSLNSAY
jgi:hypothetical protein